MAISQSIQAVPDINCVASHIDVSGLHRVQSQLAVGMGISGVDGCAKSIPGEASSPSRIPIADSARLLAGRPVRNTIPRYDAGRISRCGGSSRVLLRKSGSWGHIPLANPGKFLPENRIDTSIPRYPAIDAWVSGIDFQKDFRREFLLTSGDANADMVSAHMESAFREVFEAFGFIQPDSATKNSDGSHVAKARVLQPGMTAHDIARAYDLHSNVQAREVAKLLLRIVNSLKESHPMEKIYSQLNNKIYNQVLDEIRSNPKNGHLRWLIDDEKVKRAIAPLAYRRCLKRLEDGESYAKLQIELSNVTMHMREGASGLHSDIASICVEFSQRHPDKTTGQVFEHFGISDDEHLIRETVDLRLAREKMTN